MAPYGLHFKHIKYSGKNKGGFLIVLVCREILSGVWGVSEGGVKITLRGV